MLQRFEAWLVTGPIGFLFAGVLDVVALAAGFAAHRARQTLTIAARRSPRRGRHH